MKLIERYASRKLVAWLVSTGLLVYGVLPAEHWTAITMFWIGAQSFLDWKTTGSPAPSREMAA